MGRAPRHPVLREVLRARQEARSAYQDYLEAQVNAADADCSGVLLNTRGRARGIDPASLFMGRAAIALYYASPELVEWWESHPRVTFAQWEGWCGLYGGHWWGQALLEAELA